MPATYECDNGISCLLVAACLEPALLTPDDYQGRRATSPGRLGTAPEKSSPRSVGRRCQVPLPPGRRGQPRRPAAPRASHIDSRVDESIPYKALGDPDHADKPSTATITNTMDRWVRRGSVSESFSSSVGRYRWPVSTAAGSERSSGSGAPEAF
jgi:hypothetical protein